MKERILEIIKTKPKHFTRLIKKDTELHTWVMNNSQLPSDSSYIEHIYSALNPSVNPICENGNKKKFKSIFDGYGYCGHASKCECNRQHSAIKTSKTKKQYTNEDNNKINAKREATMIKKYGVAYNSQRAEFKPYQRLDNSVLEKLNNTKWLENEYINKKRSLVDIAEELGVYYGTVAWYCKKYGFKIRRRSNYSLIEKEIANFISTLGFDIKTGVWGIIPNKELDIYIPEKKLAIEMNGLYWHSETKNSKESFKTKHIDKTIEANKRGVQLIHITDHEWLNKQDIVKAILRSKLGLNNRIYARKCNIDKVDKYIEKEFLQANHLQGYIPSSDAYGLYYDDKLVMLMTIGKSRFTNAISNELLRFCTAPGVTVVGGASKLLKFINMQLITYCKRDHSDASGYMKMGFVKLHETSPGFFWTDGTNIISRYKAQKQNLKHWLPNYDPTVSQTENMFRNGYRRYWDCGNIVLEYKPVKK